jgi:hypothetical protein
MTKWLLIILAIVFIPGVNAEGIDALTITTNADGKNNKQPFGHNINSFYFD